MEPFSTGEALAHLRVDGDADHAYVTLLVATARARVEQDTHRALPVQSWTLALDSWAPCIELPLPPLRSVSEVRYIDTDGATQILASSAYRVDTSGEAGRIAPAFGSEWPQTRAIIGAIEIDFDAGYDVVPMPLQHAMKLLIGHWYENREQVVTGTIATSMPDGVAALISPYCVRYL